MVTSGSLDDVMISTLAWNARDGFDSHCSHNISYFHHTLDTGDTTRIIYNPPYCMVVEPTLCMNEYLRLPTACVYAIVSIKQISFPGG